MYQGWKVKSRSWLAADLDRIESRLKRLGFSTERKLLIGGILNTKAEEYVVTSADKIEVYVGPFKTWVYGEPSTQKDHELLLGISNVNVHRISREDLVGYVGLAGLATTFALGYSL